MEKETFFLFVPRCLTKTEDLFVSSDRNLDDTRSNGEPRSEESTDREGYRDDARGGSGWESIPTKPHAWNAKGTNGDQRNDLDDERYLNQLSIRL